VERKGILEERYEAVGLGSITEIERTRAVDFQIKNLPVGQMQVLTTDNRLGTLHMHMHVRRPRQVSLPTFEPVIYPLLRRGNDSDRAANLKFANADLDRRIARVSGRSRPSWR
jgi:hypothetical protein